MAVSRPSDVVSRRIKGVVTLLDSQRTLADAREETSLVPRHRQRQQQQQSTVGTPDMATFFVIA